VLTDANFKETVYGSKDVWMIEMYAPWCGHCKQLQPQWEQAARDLPEVKWGKVDCTVEKNTCSQFQVKGYPTIKYFEPMAKNNYDAKDYSGGRQADDLVNHARELFNKATPPKDLKHLSNQADFDEYCKEAKNLCIIFLLEHKLDVGEEGQKKQLEIAKKVADSYGTRGINFLWSQGGDQYEFEDKFGITGSYPRVVAFSEKKQKYLSMIPAYTAENIPKWINSLFSGRLGFYDYPKNIPELKKKDAPVEVTDL